MQIQLTATSRMQIQLTATSRMQIQLTRMQIQLTRMQIQLTRVSWICNKHTLAATLKTTQISKDKIRGNICWY